MAYGVGKAGVDRLAKDMAVGEKQNGMVRAYVRTYLIPEMVQYFHVRSSSARHKLFCPP